MKTTLLIIAIALICYLTLYRFSSANHQQPSLQHTIPHPRLEKPTLRIVFVQDVSKSIKRNGVDLIRSSTFNPYFQQTDRNIEINFGIACDMSAKQMVNLLLPAASCIKPTLPDLINASITEKKTLKQEYQQALDKFIEDSSIFFDDRKSRIAVFCAKVDSLINLYRKQLSATTDLVTAIKVADKIFNYSDIDSAKNCLLINSDGLDTYYKTVGKLKNDARIVLINANGRRNTSLDQIVTDAFASPEAAIQFSLKH